MKLYEITANYLQALDVFTDPDEEIPANIVADTLEAIEGEFEIKAVQIAAFAKQMEAEAEAIEAAIKSMKKRKEALEGRAKWLRDYVKIGIEAMGRKKLESPWFVLSIQKNPVAVDVFDEAAIPGEFKRKVVETKIDKVAIKAAIDAKKDVPGARLVNGTRLAIR